LHIRQAAHVQSFVVKHAARDSFALSRKRVRRRTQHLSPSLMREMEIICRQVEPSQWEQFSKDNAALVEQEMASSSKLRSDTEQILTAAARQLRSQADSVENALERRIVELQESRQSLEAQLNQV
jgi:Tektin family